MQAAVLLVASTLVACGGSCGPDGAADLAPAPGRTAPEITARTGNVSVTQGDATSFSVVATGSALLAIQWRRGGMTIAGASASVYTLARATQADSGAGPVVIVSNSAGSVTRKVAVMTVNPPTVAAPNLTAPATPLQVTSGADTARAASGVVTRGGGSVQATGVSPAIAAVTALPLHCTADRQSQPACCRSIQKNRTLAWA